MTTYKTAVSKFDSSSNFDEILHTAFRKSAELILLTNIYIHMYVNGIQNVQPV